MRFIFMILLIVGVCGCHLAVKTETKTDTECLKQIETQTIKQFSIYTDKCFRQKIKWVLDDYTQTGQITNADAAEILNNIVREYTEKLIQAKDKNDIASYRGILRNALWKLRYYHNKKSLPMIKKVIVNEILCQPNSDIRKEALTTYISFDDYYAGAFFLIKDVRNEPDFPHEIEGFIADQYLAKIQFNSHSMAESKLGSFLDILHSYVFNSHNVNVAYKMDQVLLDAYGDIYKKSSYRLTSIKNALREIPENGSTFFRNYFTNIIKYFNMLPLKEVNDSYPDDWSSK